MRELGTRARGSGRVYLTGGATAVLIGWRNSTTDIDLKFDPEPEGVFSAIPALKDLLDINIELAAPDQFVPPIPGWEERSLFIDRFGDVDFYHYDPLSQALAKVERGHRRDLSDVEAMIKRQMIARADLVGAFDMIRDKLIRYPSIDPDVFQEKVLAFSQQNDGDERA